jgi:sporulation protein YlmC with PRC-barrel domain
MAVLNVACSSETSEMVGIDNLTSTKITPDAGEQVGEINNIYLPFTTKDVLSGADMMVQGKVMEIIPPSSEGRFTENEEGVSLNTKDVFTYVIIESERYYFGQQQPGRIVIRLDGGKLSDDKGRAPDFIVSAPDEPVLDLGEEVILLLKIPNYEIYKDIVLPEGIAENYYTVCAGKYGKYTLQDNNSVIRLNKETGNTEKLTLSELEQKISEARSNK